MSCWDRTNKQMVKEFRALSRAEAVESMYQDMAARHRARFRNVQILRVAEIEKKEDVRRPYIKQLLEPGLKFPLPHRRTTSKNWFAANRPVSWCLFLYRSRLTTRPLGPKRLYHLYESLILWSGFGSACICAIYDHFYRCADDWLMTDSMRMDMNRLHFNIYRQGLYYKYRQLRTDLGLFPVLSLTCPLSSSVWLGLELEELGAISLNDEQSKMLERSIDFLLLFGIVLSSGLGKVQ